MATKKYIRKEIERYRPSESVSGQAVELAKSMAKTSDWHIDKACAFVARALGSVLVGNIGPDWVKPELATKEDDIWETPENWPWR